MTVSVRGTAERKDGVPGRRWEGVLGKLRSRPVPALLIAALCVVIVGVAGYLLGMQAWAYYHWRQAGSALERVELAAAKKHLAVCAEIWPNSAETHFLMARTCRRDGDLAAARLYLKRTEELGWVQDLIDLEYLLMQAQIGAIRPIEPLLLAHLTKGHRDDRLILEAMVKGYVQVNILGEAYHWATIWQERYPSDWQAFYWRGLALDRGSMQNLAPEAAADYQRALELNPDLIDARLRLGETLVRLGQYADAVGHLKAYLGEHPDHATATAALARGLRMSGKSEEAKRLLDEWLSRNPGTPIVYMIRGQIELEQDRPQEALQWLLRAQAKSWANVELNHTFAQVHRRLGRQEEARRYEELNKELEKDFKRMEVLTQESYYNAKNVAVRHEAGTILLRHGRHEEAARWLLSALIEEPEHKPTHKALAELYKNLGDLRRADEHRRRAQE